MDTSFSFFTAEQGNMLIRLLIAHLLADFMLQTKKMVEAKSWFAPYMFAHIFIVYLSSSLITGWWGISLAIAAVHYIIDSLKISVKNIFPKQELQLFLLDQVLHVATLLAAWIWAFGIDSKIWDTLKLTLTDYRISLLLLGYIFVTTPVGFIIKFATQNMVEENPTSTASGGKTIGIFERIIILTMVLLGQFGAIGFLITGKSILRFASKNDEHIRSEYLLVGTMMSYAFAILTGVTIHWLLNIYA